MYCFCGSEEQVGTCAETALAACAMDGTKFVIGIKRGTISTIKSGLVMSHCEQHLN